MSLDKLVDSSVLDAAMRYTANRIRAKTGGSENLPFDMSAENPKGFGDAVDNIQTGGTPTGTKQITITENGTTTEDVTNYAGAEIRVNVPNTYAAADEGKVVSNGALVSQTSDTVTANDTYDTTLINSLTVIVSGGGGILKKSYKFTLAQNSFYYAVPIDENVSDIVFAHWWDEDAVYTTAGTSYEGIALGPAEKKYQAATEMWLIWRTHATNGATGYTNYGGDAFSNAGYVKVSSSPALLAGHTYNLDIFIRGAS